MLADEVENDIMMKSFCGDKFYEKSIFSFSRRIITGRYLGIAIANIINVLNPEAVIIEGKIIEAGEFVFQSIRETVKNKALSYPLKHVKIMPGMLGKDGVAIGAGTLIFERFLKFSKLKFSK